MRVTDSEDNEVACYAYGSLGRRIHKVVGETVVISPKGSNFREGLTLDNYWQTFESNEVRPKSDLPGGWAYTSDINEVSGGAG